MFVYLRTFCNQIASHTCIEITMNAITERQRANFYIYKKQNIMRNVFIYKNADTSQKARHFPFFLNIQKARHFKLRIENWSYPYNK